MKDDSLEDTLKLIDIDIDKRIDDFYQAFELEVIVNSFLERWMHLFHKKKLYERAYKFVKQAFTYDIDKANYYPKINKIEFAHDIGVLPQRNIDRDAFNFFFDIITEFSGGALRVESTIVDSVLLNEIVRDLNGVLQDMLILIFTTKPLKWSGKML